MPSPHAALRVRLCGVEARVVRQIARIDISLDSRANRRETASRVTARQMGAPPMQPAGNSPAAPNGGLSAISDEAAFIADSRYVVERNYAPGTVAGSTFDIGIAASMTIVAASGSASRSRPLSICQQAAKERS
jgi:hypothetical protein